jgi:hypothetical protein
MADARPIIKVTNITVGVIPFRPMTNSCSSSSSAGRDSIAITVRGAIRL